MKNKTPKISKNNRGQPTKSKPEGVADQVEQYLKSLKDEYDKNGKLVYVDLPTAEKFAKFLNISRDTLYSYSQSSDKYRHALERIKEEQKDQLLGRGLAKSISEAIARLMLVTNHGMKEEKAKDDSGNYHLNAIRRIYELADQQEKEMYGDLRSHIVTG